MNKKIAIVARTNDRARELAHRLGLPDAVKISASSRHAGRGLVLDAILVDDTARPLSLELRQRLLPCLAATGGRMYSMTEGP